MEIKELYMQASFQMHYDDSASGDHTFKLAQLIASVGRLGKVFTVSYTIMTKLGFVGSNRLKFTKANDEIRPIMNSMKDAWLNSGAGSLC